VQDLNNILNEEDDLRNDDLLKYMQGDLSRDEQYKVEKQIAGSDFVSDAMDGLQSMKSPKSIEQYVDELNRQLQKQVATKKHRKEKRKLKDQPWIIIAVVVVIGLCILAYAVIKYYHKQSAPPDSIQTQKKK
jgi:hypothetical protein